MNRYKFLAYPRLVRDPDYLYAKLSFLLGDIDPASFRMAFDGIVGAETWRATSNAERGADCCCRNALKGRIEFDPLHRVADIPAVIDVGDIWNLNDDKASLVLP
jgi:hypothetical protein